MNYHFEKLTRLGIQVPVLHKNWEEIEKLEQEKILVTWEAIKGTIPDRIFEMEEVINFKQAQLGNEDNFEKSCLLNSEISELASRINDLWIWFRTGEEIRGEKAHS